MTEQELEQVIQEFLVKTYCAVYIGKLKIKKLEPFGFHISFGMNTPECPYVIYAELKDKDFLKLLKEELRSSKFSRVFYGKCLKTMPPECNVINRACSCNDK